MLDVKKVDEMIKSGLSAVCAWCEHFWTQNDKDAICVLSCGGPNSHKAFPMYKGPYEGKIQDMCFVCGGVPDAIVDINGQGVIGVCNNHMDLMKEMIRSRPRTKVNVIERQVINLMDLLTNSSSLDEN